MRWAGLAGENFAVAKKLFGKNCRISPVRGSNKVFKALFSNGKKRILKRSHITEKTEKTRTFQEFVRKRGIPAPKVFSVKTGGPSFFTEMEFVTGKLASQKWVKLGKNDRESVVSQIAKTIVELHAIKPSEIIKKTDGAWKKRAYNWEKSACNWDSFIKHGINKNLEITLRYGIVEKSLAEKIVSFLDKTSLPKKIEPCIVHGDLWLENIFLDESNKINAIIDWENSFLGHHEFDLATTRITLRKSPKHFSRVFLDAYKDFGGDVSENYGSSREVYELFKTFNFLSFIGLEKKYAGEVKRALYSRLLCRIRGIKFKGKFQ